MAAPVPTRRSGLSLATPRTKQIPPLAPVNVHRQRLQLIHNPRAHLHQPTPVPKQLPQITIPEFRFPPTSIPDRELLSAIYSRFPSPE
jgi:hypothetical protein